MGLQLRSFQKDAKAAVKTFWKNRNSAITKQKARGRQDTGQRAAVTTGKNMDGFLTLITNVVRRNGLKHASIHLRKGLLTLPGYYRPTKQWDILVMNDSLLIAAIELKSQVGSFGNNFNNRAEEAIGTAADLGTAYRENALGNHSKPFLGWLMLLEDCPASRQPVQDRSPHFPIFPEFNNCSYAERYDILCQKLVKEDLYTAATLLLSPKSAASSGAYAELSAMTGLKSFVASLAGHVAAEAAKSAP